MDGGAKCSVTNIVEILWNVTWFDQLKQDPVCMRGETSGNIIVPMTKDWLWVQVGNTRTGYINVLCYYSPYFTSTLLSEQDVLQLSPFTKEFSGQVMTKCFKLND